MRMQIEERLRRRRLPAPPIARAIRLAAGATQEDVAAEMGVHRVTVARWELGTARPTGTHAERYAELLDRLSDLAGEAVTA